MGIVKKIGFWVLGCDVEVWNSFLKSELQPPPAEGPVNTLYLSPSSPYPEGRYNGSSVRSLTGRSGLRERSKEGQDMQQWTPPAGIFTTLIYKRNEAFAKNTDWHLNSETNDYCNQSNYSDVTEAITTAPLRRKYMQNFITKTITVLRSALVTKL